MTGWDRPAPGECLCGKATPCPDHGAWAGTDPLPPRRPAVADRRYSDDEILRLRQLGWQLQRTMTAAPDHPHAQEGAA